MNQSKRILAALVAIPASVIVAGEVQAAENTTTFEINNSFINGGSAIEAPIQETNLVEGLKNELFNKMSNFQNASFYLDVTNIPANETKLGYAQKEVEKVFDYLKSNLNATTSGNYDTTLLYGMLNNVKVVATEVKTNNVVNQVKLDFTFNYLMEKSYQTTVDAIYNVVKDNSNLSGILGVKAVHDYLINQAYVDSTKHGLLRLATPNSGLSSHAYAMWTYLLMNKAASETGSTYEVRYVYGMSGGKLQSWNLVKIGGTWYPLDVANDDNGMSGSKFIQYRYFLTDDNIVGKREIYFGNNDITTIGSNDIFANIVNPIKDGNILYFVDATDGKIKSVDISDPSPGIKEITKNETTKAEKLLHFKNTSNNGLYFINTSNGNYLYEYDLKSSTGPQLVIKQPIASFKIEGTNLIYIAVGETVDIKISLTNGINQGMVDYVTNYINGIVVEMDPTNQTQTYINKVVQAQKLYYILTNDQKGKLDLKVTENLKDLEESLKSTNSDVIDLIDQIKALDIEDTGFVRKVEEAYNIYTTVLDQANRNLVYNKQILIDANKLVSDKIALENEIYNFIKAYEDPVNRKSEFYSELEGLINRYDSLHQNLKTEPFKSVTYTALVNLGNNTTFRTDIQDIRNTLNILNLEAENYLELMDTIKLKYSPLTTSQKGLLTAEEIRLVEENLSKATQMKTVLTEFKGYMLDISNIDNTGTPPTALDPALINKMKRADELLTQGIKASQWKGILSGTSLDKDTVTNKVKGFLARAKLVQDGVVTLAPAATAKIDALDQLTFTDPQDYINKVQAVEDALIDLVGNDSEKLNALLSLLNTTVVAKYQKYLTIKGDIDPVVSGYIDDITDLEADTSKSEADVDALIAIIKALDPIYQSLITNSSKLNEMKKAFVDVQDKQVAANFILEVNYLLLEENSTYNDVKKVWEKFLTLSNASEVFKEEVESNSIFNKLETLWVKVAGDKAIIDALNAKIAAANEKTSEEDLQKILDEYGVLSQETKNQIVNIEKIEDYLSDIKTKKAGESVEQLINKIKGLSDDATPLEIQALRDEYNALTDELKVLIPANVLKILESFEKQMATQLEAATKEAQPVIDRINKIDLNKYTEAQITSIYNAYGALSLLAKDVVMKSGTYEKLMKALDHVKYQNTVAKQAKLEAAAFDEHMNKLDRNSSTAEIAAARALYNRLSYEAKKHVQTYDKLVRLETMWKDPEYIELVHTYYPDYIHAIKPGGIEITKPNYDSLYIPDDSVNNNVANYLPTEATWSSYEEMTYRSGRYVANITSSQVKNLSDRTLTLKADEIEIVLPVVDLKGTSGTVGVSVALSNNQLNIQFTENGNAKTFSEYVEIRVPISAFKGKKYQMIERIVSNSGTAASFKVDGADFVIRTKSSGTFQGATSNVNYNDLGTSSAGNAVREFAKRGITYNTTGRSVQMTKQVTRADVATLISKALDLSSSTKTKYQDLGSAISASRAQALQDAGIMSGVTSSRFGINTTITKQEAAIIIANMYRYLDQDLSKAYNALKTNYTDVSNLTFEARQSIAILELFGVADGNGKFNPNEHLTRGQFAELLYKSLTAIDFL